MTSDRKKPSVAFWATVGLVVVLVAYPLSFGQACWLSSRTSSMAGRMGTIYKPITWGMSQRETQLHRLIQGYAQFKAKAGWEWHNVAHFPLGASDEMGSDEMSWEWICPTSDIPW
jgi:hypothetical protein